MVDASRNTQTARKNSEGALVTLVSASGGTGKSTLALLLGHVAAWRKVKCAILEGDLQFGDMGFWLGLDVSLSDLSQGTDCIGVPISNGLDLFKAPVLPEVAEETGDEVAKLLPMVLSRYDLVIADTGQFWSGLTAELVCSSDLVVLMMDRRRSSVYGAIKAMDLCQRLGIPLARIACVMNKATGIPKTELEHIRSSLDADELFKVSDGKAAVETLIETGRIEEMLETQASPVPDVEAFLARTLPRVGIEFSATGKKKARRLFR